MKNKLCILTCENFSKELAAVIKSDEFDDTVMSVFPARCGRPPLNWDEIGEVIRGWDNCVQCKILGGSCCAKLEDSRKESEESGKCFIQSLGQCFY